jgi:hypothetical protein
MSFVRDIQRWWEDTFVKKKLTVRMAAVDAPPHLAAASHSAADEAAGIDGVAEAASRMDGIGAESEAASAGEGGLLFAIPIDLVLLHVLPRLTLREIVAVSSTCHLLRLEIDSCGPLWTHLRAEILRGGSERSSRSASRSGVSSDAPSAACASRRAFQQAFLGSCAKCLAPEAGEYSFEHSQGLCAPCATRMPGGALREFLNLRSLVEWRIGAAARRRTRAALRELLRAASSQMRRREFAAYAERPLCLAFNSRRDGHSLNLLQNTLARHAPCLLVVKEAVVVEDAPEPKPAQPGGREADASAGASRTGPLPEDASGTSAADGAGPADASRTGPPPDAAAASVAPPAPVAAAAPPLSTTPAAAHDARARPRPRATARGGASFGVFVPLKLLRRTAPDFKSDGARGSFLFRLSSSSSSSSSSDPAPGAEADWAPGAEASAAGGSEIGAGSTEGCATAAAAPMANIYPGRPADGGLMVNSFYMMGNDLVAFGGDRHAYALQLAADLQSGLSLPCPTFRSPTLASAPSFETSSVEIWRVVDAEEELYEWQAAQAEGRPVRPLDEEVEPGATAFDQSDSVLAPGTNRFMLEFVNMREDLLLERRAQ